MHTYRIYTHPAHTTEAVKIGWSWPGLFLSLLWVLFQCLWWVVGSLGMTVFSIILLHVFIQGDMADPHLFGARRRAREPVAAGVVHRAGLHRPRVGDRRQS